MATISNNDIARAIYLSSEGKSGPELSAHLKNVVKILARKRLLGKTPDILMKLSKISDKNDGLINVKISSASPLSGEIKHEITHSLLNKYKAKKVNFKEIINEKLIGGFKIEMEDEVMDFTLKNKVEQLQKYLTKN